MASSSNGEINAKPLVSRLITWPLYLGTVGLAYQVAYWSKFGINVIEYGSIQSLVTLSVAPLALAIRPILLLILAILVFETILSPIFDGLLALLSKAIGRWIPYRTWRGVVAALIGVPVAVVFVLACSVALSLFAGQPNEVWAWLVASGTVAVIAIVFWFKGSGESVASIERFLNDNPLIWAGIASLPFLSYALGMGAAERARVTSESPPLLQWLLQGLPNTQCVALANGTPSQPTQRFVGHINGYDFYYQPFGGQLLVRAPTPTEDTRLIACEPR